MIRFGMGCLVDFKTSAAASPWLWSLQGASIIYWPQENGMHFRSEVLFVQLKENGKFQEYMFEVTPNHLAVCVASVNTFRYLKTNGVIRD